MPYTLRRWFLDTLCQAGTEVSPRSTRAVAITNTAATHTLMVVILAQGDWARARTIHKHYLRALPQELALQHLALLPNTLFTPSF